MVGIVDQPVVTLNPATDLTGVGALNVPEGVTLNLTAAQFQQLTGSGTINIIDTDGNAGNDAINVNITDLAQADVTPGFVVTGVNVGGGELTITLAESVVFTSTAANIFEGVNGEKATINIGDGLKLTLAEITQIDEMDINGGAGSTVEFTDVTGFLQSVNASGLDVDFLRLPALLVSGNNVDFMFADLAERVEKVIYEGIGTVDGRAQLVTVEEGVTIFGDVSFNDYLLGTEVTDLVVDLQGGTLVDGNLVFSTVQVNDQNGNGTFDGTDFVELVPTYLQELTINSSGTDTNTINGDTANVIEGNVTPGAFGPAVGIGSRDNQLKSVTINATQALQINGAIIFSSHSVAADNGTLNNEPNDGITANDDDSAIASLVVNGDSDVTIGSLDTSDDDIDGLNVVNNLTAGVLSATLNAATVDASDVLSFTGPGDTALTVVGGVDLSNDVLTSVDTITIADNAVLTLTQAQFDAIGGPDIIDGGMQGLATLNIVNFGSGAFDATTIDPDIAVNLTLASGNVTLNGNFTGVDSLNVVEGSTVTMTAAQFQQLQGSGTINVLDGPDALTVAGDSGINIVITDLTQADVDAGFSLAGVNVGIGGTVNITLGEATVDLATYDADGMLVGNVAVLTTADTLGAVDPETGGAFTDVRASFTLTDGQTLGVASLDQTGSQTANEVDATGGPRLVVNGTGTTVVEFKFIPPAAPLFPEQIDASGYNVSELRVLAGMFGVPGDANVEYTLDDLGNVTLVLYQTPQDLGFLSETFRVVVIEQDVTTPGTLIFSDWDPGDEVRELDITFEGNSLINGNLAIPTRIGNGPNGEVRQFFDELTIRSEGATANRINGDITTATVLGAPNTSENNLLTVNFVLDQDMIVGDDATAPFVFTTGIIRFNSTDITANNATATLNTTGTGDLFLKGIDTTEAVGGTPGDISTLVINNNSTGLLTITGGSDALELGVNNTVLEFNGVGDVLLDTNTGMDTDATANNGIDGGSLSSIDASGLSGNLTLGVIEDISDANFTFVTGTGVTKATMLDAALDSTGALPTSADDTPGWVIDYSDAAPGSEFHLNWGTVLGTEAWVDGSKLSINMGPNGTLFIDGPTGSFVDLSDLVLDIDTVQSIVLGDEVTLILTAQQADGLNIISGPNTDGDLNLGTVNIVDLTDDPGGPVPFDLSGIAANIAGTITFAATDEDVTLDAATDLGAFSITLEDNFGDSTSLAGQTIRFNTVEQADGREIIVNPDGGTVGDSSTNVVWLFDDIAAPVNTGGYDDAIGRLWVRPELVNGEGGDVEQLFTVLPNTILRVEFSTLDQLNVLLSAQSIDRIVEFVHFTDLNDLTFSDVGGTPDQFVRSLELRFGGEVNIGDVNISDVIVGATVNPTSVYFNGITLNSFRAVERESATSGEILSAVDYRNDNDGNAEAVTATQNENVAPDAPNVVGDITGDDTNAQIDLLDVTINTQALRTNNIPNGGATAGIDSNGSDNTRGEAIVVGTITYDSSGVANPNSTHAGGIDNANLRINGANNVTITAINTADVDINTLTMNLSGFSAILDPVLNVDNTENIFLVNVNAVSDDDGALAIFQEVEGDELSFFDASGYDANLEVTFSQIDSSNEDRDVVPDGITPGDDTDAAFTFTAGSGTSDVTVAAIGGNIPTLNADSEWIFDFDATSGAFNGGASQLIIDESVVFAADSYLTLIDASTYITGDVDLSEVNLVLVNNDDVGPAGGDDDMRIYVGAGSSLTISVAQALALGDVEIVGEGTVFLVGDASNADGAVLGANLKTAVVDASAVTIVTAAGPGVDAEGEFELTLTGALALTGTTAIGQTVIGTDFDDVLTIEPFPSSNTLDYSYFGGPGDDTYLGVAGFSGDRFYNVDEDTDFIPELYSSNVADPENDPATINGTLIVSAGATANASVYAAPGFAATSETSNAGVANITDTSGAAITIDLSRADGPNGYNITGSGDDILIGSDFADVINGGNDANVGGDFDTLTGGGAGDTFVFNVQLSTGADFTETLITQGIDNEEIDFTGIVDDNGGTETVTITYSRNGGSNVSYQPAMIMTHGPIRGGRWS
ncbi:hypothetical protein [Parasphingorhabdus sp.]|uniref:hypothetical protein n=1 Tax=Parasphingorhabdus sp. TaxID=2709688 RepID=UPI0030019330